MDDGDNQGISPEELEVSITAALTDGDLGLARELLSSTLDGPQRAAFIAQYAVVLFLQEDPDAVQWLEIAVKEAEQPVMALINLGTAREREGRLDEARKLFVEALTHEPMSSEALLGLGRVEFLDSRHEEALSAFRRAHTFDRTNPKPLWHLVSVFEVMREADDAADIYRQLFSVDENVVKVATSLIRSTSLLEAGPLEQSLFDYIDAHPKDIEVRVLLGKYLLTASRATEAVKVLSSPNFDPSDHGEQTLTLAVAYHDLGFSEKANLLLMTYLRTKEPTDFNWSPLLLLQHYLPGRSQEDISRLHHIWGEHQPRERKPKVFKTDERRVTFVGGDFRNHPVGFFCVPLFEGLKERGYKLDIFDTRPNPDATADRLRAAADGLFELRGLSDEEVMRIAQERKGHFAIDLAGHTRGARLSLFAQRLAPVQFTAYGYVNTTGLKTMDGILSDPYQVLESEEASYSEEILRLPDTYIVYEAPPWMPALQERNEGQPLTFGSLNRAAKLGPQTIVRFSRLLLTHPGSRFILASPGLNNPLIRQDICGRFAAHGVGSDRLVFRGGCAHAEFLKNYNDIDIAVDTAPYSGGITTCEALMMGTPVITVPSSTMASRHSLGHLTNAGFETCVFETEDALVEGSVEVAERIRSGKLLKADVRALTSASKLCDRRQYLDAFCGLLERFTQ